MASAIVKVVKVEFNKYAVVGKKFSLTFSDKETALEFCSQRGLIIKD